MNFNESMMKRLNLLHRSIDISYQQLKDVLYNGDIEEVFISLKSLLDLIFSADEMHFNKRYHEKKDSDEKGKFLNGLRYATNLIKHEKICIEVHRFATTPMFSFLVCQH